MARNFNARTYLIRNKTDLVPKLKIVHICYYDYLGGASIAASRLHRALNNRSDTISELWVQVKRNSDCSQFVFCWDDIFSVVEIKAREFFSRFYRRFIRDNNPVMHSMGLLSSRWGESDQFE